MGHSLKPIQIEQKELDAQQNLDDLLVGGVGSVIWVERQSALSTEEKKVKIMALNTINFFFPTSYSSENIRCVRKPLRGTNMFLSLSVLIKLLVNS